jgi:Right handed beta helix region
VRNNQFLHNRARGALLQTPYGLVEGNTFSGQMMYPLLLTTFPPEGPGAQNLLIANNQISDSGVGGGPGAIIIARQQLVYSALAHNPPAQQNLIFVDNLIHDVPGPAFYISSANAVTLYRNTLQNTNYQTTDNKWNGAGDINSPIVINDASNILLLHNSIHPAPEVKTPISVDAGTTTGIKISEGTP